MKKFAAVAMSLALMLALAGCGGGIKDGTYTAKASAASHGWTDYLKVTYKGGAITDVDFDSEDASGNLKSKATDDTYPMTPPPREWIPKLEANIKAAASSDKIEAVAGASNSSKTAKLLMAAVEKQAKAGKTDVVLVDLPAEK